MCVNVGVCGAPHPVNNKRHNMMVVTRPLILPHPIVSLRRHSAFCFGSDPAAEMINAICKENNLNGQQMKVQYFGKKFYLSSRSELAEINNSPNISMLNMKLLSAAG